MIKLILGGARSGKSRFAEQLAQMSNNAVTAVVTAQPFDDEMRQRILRHQQDRPGTWQTIEAPIELAAALAKASQKTPCILLDCLTLWLNNCLLADAPDSDGAAPGVIWRQQKQALLAALKDFPGELIIVSNEVGQGIVPLGALSRQFVDEAGWLNQAIAAQADHVFFVTAGIPQQLK